MRPFWLEGQRRDNLVKQAKKLRSGLETAREIHESRDPDNPGTAHGTNGRQHNRVRHRWPPGPARSAAGRTARAHRTDGLKEPREWNKSSIEGALS